MPAEVWAEEVRRRPGLHGASVPMSLDYFPPQREMLTSIFDPLNQEVVFQIFSRGTKSETILTAIGYCIDQTPRRFIVMWPTTSQAEKWSKDDLLEQLIAPTPRLNDLLGDGQGKRRSSNTILYKIYPGGLLNIVGANSPGELRRAKGNFLYGDEIDAIDVISSDEGDQLAQLKKRGSEYPDTIEVYASYPSLKGKSRIQSKLDETDCNQWHVPCLLCGFDRWVMNRTRDLRSDRDNPAGARLECPNCHGLLDDAQRYQMMRTGLWIPTQEFKGKKGFHANALLWPHPVSPDKYPGGFLQMLAQQEIDAEAADNPERARRVLVNTVDAEPYEPKYESKVKHTDLYVRREDYDPKLKRELPEGVILINAGFDVQSDRIEGEIVGFGLDDQTWGIEYVVIPGSPLTPDPWQKLDKILNRAQWKHPLYGWMGIKAAGIDCGYKPDEVLKFTRPRRSRRVFAVFGSTTLGKAFVSKPVKRGSPPTPAFELGTHEAKDMIYQRLELTDKNAHGFMHFPSTSDYDEGYFKGLTLENSTMKRGKDGDFYRFFENPPDGRNEPLDCRVYAMAMPRIIRANLRKIAENLESRKDEIPAEPDMARPDLSKPAPKPPPVRRGGGFASGGGGGGFAGGWR